MVRCDDLRTPARGSKHVDYLHPHNAAGNGPLPQAHSALPPPPAAAASNILLAYIDRLLMAEDVDENFEQSPEHPALLAAEKPFLDILRAPLPPPPGEPGTAESPHHNAANSAACAAGDGRLGAAQTPAPWFPAAAFLEAPQLRGGFGSERAVADGGDLWPYDLAEIYQMEITALYDLSSSNGPVLTPDFAVQRQPVLQWGRGLEDASGSPPDEGRLVIDLDAPPRWLSDLPAKDEEDRGFVEIKNERDVDGAVRSHSDGGDLDAEEGRSNKQSAIDTVGIDLIRDMMDNVLLCEGHEFSKGVESLRETLQHNVASHARESGKGRGRGKKQDKKGVVDLETLLLHCAQAVATDDRRGASEILRQIRRHASTRGDANERAAQCFADGLEARLAGNGRHIFRSFTMRQYAAGDVLKAYQLYLAACPFKKVSHLYSNRTILNAAMKAEKVHIIDYGIYYGFQWPCLLKNLSTRPGGPPKVRITGIDTPQPGLRPSERMDETGRYLAEYAKTFDVPFEFRAVPVRPEAVRIEDLRIEKDEVLIVFCQDRLKTLLDESVMAESPRDMVLDTIRKMNPHVFIHCVPNAPCNTPFFAARFREALFHYSAIFDMLDTNIPRDNEERLLLESAVLRKEVINVISCEGSQRIERLETYKRWTVRKQRAGLKQLQLDGDIMRLAKEMMKCYHKDYTIYEDNQWLLLGWKGRILYAVSTWKAETAST